LGKKIAFICSSLECGGAEKCLSLLANELCARNFNVSVTTLYRNAGPPFFSLHEEIEFFPVGLFGRQKGRINNLLFNLIGLAKLRSHIKMISPDIIVSFLDWVNILTVLSTIGTRIPVVISERADPRHGEVDPLLSLLRRAIYLQSALIHVQTRALADYFCSFIARDKIKVIPNPVQIPQDQTASLSSRTILAIGRLTYQKGFDCLIKAFAALHVSFPDWRLVIAGEGPERRNLESLIRAHNLSDSTKLKGEVKQPSQLYRDAGIFVLSSRFEGFPNVLCEAMSFGLPCISTNCPSGPAEIITHEKDGLLIETDNISALAAALQRLITNEEERKQLGVQARNSIARFQIGRIVDQWQDLFTELKPASN